MIKIGDLVHWQYFNTPERKFYGPVRQGKVIDVISYNTSHNVLYQANNGKHWTHNKFYVVQWFYQGGCHYATLQRKEIKRVLKG